MTQLFLVAIWILLAASAARANEVAMFQTDSAVASFVSVDSPCVTTSANVFASNHIKRFDQISTSGAFITVKRRDHCNGIDLIDAVGVPLFQANEFVLNKSLKAASLVADIAVHDFVSGMNLPARINLKWSKTSRLIRAWTLTSDDFVFIVAKQATKTYFATAGGEISLANEQFTPNATQNAAISADDNMFVIRQ